MDDDLGIGTRLEGVAERLKLCHQGLDIVDLAVVDDAHRAVLVELRLVAGQEVDDREPAMPQPEPRREVETLAVRSPVGESIGHPAHQRAVDIAARAEIKDPGYAAHFLPPNKAERWKSTRIRPSNCLIRYSSVRMRAVCAGSVTRSS